MIAAPREAARNRRHGRACGSIRSRAAHRMR